MKKTINKNDLVVIQKNVEDLKEQDIIVINRNNEIIISRIYKIEEYLNENVFIIKGDNNLYPSNESLSKEDIEGKMGIKIPFAGYLFEFLQSKTMTFILIILLFIKFRMNIKIKRRKKLALSIDKTIKS